MKKYFKDLNIGTQFKFNGNTYIKKSTRTVYLEQYNRVFYFEKNNLVEVV